MKSDFNDGFSKINRLWTLAFKDNFYKTIAVHFILFTNLSPYFILTRFQSNHCESDIVKYYFFSSTLVLEFSLIKLNYQNMVIRVFYVAHWSLDSSILSTYEQIRIHKLLNKQ